MALQETHALTIATIITNVTGNVCLSRGMRHAGEGGGASVFDYLHHLSNPWALFGVVILALWMLLDLALLSRADLSFVLPVTSSAYVLIAIVGHFILGENISWARWMGILAITLGVILAERTPARTTPEHQQCS